MLNPESDIAEQLANALKHHQKNLVEKNKAEKKVETLRHLVTELEALAEESGKND